MAGVTDRAFREIVYEQYPGPAYTEMISAMALLYANQRTFRMLEVEAYRPLAVQLFGSNPEVMARAAMLVAKVNPDFLDINMGCPTPKIVKNGEGSALMRNPDQAARIVAAVAKTVDIPVSVKIRSGWDQESINAPQFAAKMVAAGAQLITVHGRTRSQFYSGHADWEVIQAVAETVSVPVIGNGDIDSLETAIDRLNNYGCSGIMIGRHSLGNPWLVARIRRYFAEGVVIPEPTWEERLEVMLQHLKRAVTYYGAEIAVRQMRKHLAWYLKGLPDTGAIKAEIQRATTVEETKHILQSYQETLKK